MSKVIDGVEHYDVSEVAAKTGRTTKAVDHWIADGKLESTLARDDTNGRKKRWVPRPALEQFIAARAAKETAPRGTADLFDAAAASPITVEGDTVAGDSSTESTVEPIEVADTVTVTLSAACSTVEPSAIDVDAVIGDTVEPLGAELYVGGDAVTIEGDVKDDNDAVIDNIINATIEGDAGETLGSTVDRVGDTPRRVLLPATAPSDDDLAVAKTFLPDYLKSIGCVINVAGMCSCINSAAHAHGDQHPSMKVYNDDHFHCFGCGVHGSIVDAIMIHEGVDLATAIARAKEFAGVGRAPSTPLAQLKSQGSLVDALKAASAVEYLHSRGFAGDADAAVLKRAGVLFAPWINCLIFPHANGSYSTRALIGDERYVHNPRGAVTLFNADALETAKEIVLCEGVIDALSVMCCGWQAVTMGGVQATAGKKFVNALLSAPTSPAVIIAFDSDKAGNAAADTFLKNLNGAPIKTARLDLRCFKDVNEFFKADRERLQAELTAARERLTAPSVPPPVASTDTPKTEHTATAAKLAQDAKNRAKARGLALNKYGYPQATVLNFDAVLNDDSVLQELVGFDAFKQQKVLTKEPPWACDEHVWSSYNEKCMKNYIERNYALRHNDLFDAALTEYAHRRAFHPVQDYFNELPPWDRQFRAERLFIDNLGADDTDYIRAVTRHWLLAAVARVFHPACKFDYCLVLKGRQGIGKSTLLSQLCVKPDWFLALQSLQGKDSVINILGRWIIELVEMQGLHKADTDQIKSFISETQDVIRLPYDKRESVFKRQCVFAATTNDSTFLKDQTGNRRFWIVECNANDYALRAELDIKQIWAEVYHWYRELFADGFDASRLDLPRALKPIAADIACQHTEGNDDLAEIEEFLARPIPKQSLWQLLTKEERREYFKKGKVPLPIVRVEEHAVGGKDMVAEWGGEGLILIDAFNGTSNYVILTADMPAETRKLFFDGDGRRQYISPAEISNELWYEDRVAANRAKRITEQLRRLDGWRQVKARRDKAYSMLATVFERIEEN